MNWQMNKEGGIAGMFLPENSGKQSWLRKELNCKGTVTGGVTEKDIRRKLFSQIEGISEDCYVL